MAYNGNFILVNKLQDKLVNIHQAFNTTKKYCLKHKERNIH